MRPRKLKHLYFRIFALVLLAGVIALGYYQFQWIRTATSVEEQRRLKEMYVSTERALDKAFDEIRALISFSYVGPAHIHDANWKDVDSSIAFWKEQSAFPLLLLNVLIIPAAAGEPYLSYDESKNGFVPIDTPPDFELYERYLSAGSAADAYLRTYPPLMPKGYFILPLPRYDGGVDGAAKSDELNTSGFLAVRVDTELFYKEVLPGYLDEYSGFYKYRIMSPDEIFHSTAGRSEVSRQPDVIIPILRGLYPDGGGKPPRGNNAMENPISRFWFLRTEGLPGIEGRFFTPQEIRNTIPTLEVYYPDRSLESAMRWRMISSLLLSAGTLLVLLTAYFVLYVLLVRTGKLRSRERDFVTSMSHELRTPLSVISATSDNLIRGIVDTPDKIKKYGNLIQTQSKRLGKMVESILVYSGMESMEAGSMRMEEVNLERFFDEIIQNLAPTAEEAGAKIVLTKDTRIETVQTDPNALRIIIENLIVNALHHGVIPNTNAEVRVAIRTRPPRLLFLTIEDDGPGIPPGEIKRIFEPFARGERSKAGQVPGSGLGLHIVRRVSTQLGGQVAVESPYADMAGAVRQGARFTVKIPVKVEA